MNSKIIYIIVVLVAIAATGAFLFGPSDHRDMQSNQVTNESKSNAEQFSGFSLKDYSGKVVQGVQFQGKPLVVNSWASWCPFCKAELPAFADVQDQLKGQVIIVAIDRGESLDVAKQYSDSVGATRRLVLLVDPEDSFYKSIGGFSMPETIFVDKNGNIQYHKRGPMDKQEILQRIQSLISQP